MSCAKKLSIILCIVVGMCSLTKGEKPIFYASFDKTFTADKALGKLDAVTKEEVNLETLGFYLKKGVKGKALLCGLSNDKVPRPLNCIFDAHQNINNRQGTVMFWVKPVNWQGTENRFQLLFESKGQKSWLLVYKYFDSKELLFLYGQTDDGKSPQKWSVTRANIAKWDSSQWHFIACTWSPKLIKLYIDGQLKSKNKVKFPAKTAFKTFAIGGLYPDKWKPLGGQSFIDELKIYDVPLAEKAILKQWLKDKPQVKHSKISIGVGARTVKIDGTIKEGEYSFSGTGFFDLKGIYSQTQSNYYISYDKNNIYIAVKSPVLEPFLMMHHDRDSRIYKDDSIEVFFSPTTSNRRYYQFVVNANNAILDACVKDTSWNAASFPIKSKIEGKYWTIEMAFPYATFGVSAPKKGDKWKLNICRSFSGIKSYTSISPNRKSMLGYHDYAHFPTLTFLQAMPVTAIGRIGALNNSELDLIVNLLPASKAGPKCDIKTILESDGKCWINKEKNYQLNVNKPVNYNVTKKNFGREGTLKLKINDTTNDIVIYNGEFSFKNTPAFDVVSIHTDIEKQDVIIKFKFNKILDKGDVMCLEMKDKKSGKILALKEFEPKDLILTESLPISKLLPGHYDLIISLKKDKKVLFSCKREFAKPESPAVWAGNTLGVSKTVPIPWIPVKLIKQNASSNSTKFELSTWGRRIQYTEKSPFPSQISSQTQTLLANPIALKIVKEGQALPAEKINFDSFAVNDTNADFRVSANVGNIKLQVTTTIEYDGFMWYDIELIPQHGPTVIDTMTFDIPLKPECATLLHTLYKGYNRRKAGTGLIGPNGWQANLFEKPIFWVGNEDVGLQWFAENLKGWDLQNEAHSLKIIVKENVTLVRLTLIDHPITLDKEKKISFGLMPTPVRPKRKNWRNIRLGKNLHAWFPYTKYFNYPDKNYIKKEFGAKPNFSKTKNVCFYHAIYGLTPYCPEWPYWAAQWERIPPPSGTLGDLHNSQWTLAQVCTNSTSYRDFYVWKMSNAIKDMDLSNLYFDLGVPRVCHNHLHGCGWKDMKGKERKSYNILGTRDIAKRIYTEFKRLKPDGIIINHMSEEPAMPVLSFSDIMVDGELYCLQVAEDESYYNVFTPDSFRASFLSRQWGPLQIFIPQFERASICYRPERRGFWKTEEAQPAIQHFMGYLLAHDVKCWPNFGVKMDKTWHIQDKFGWDSQTQFVPYWNKENPFKVVNNNSNNIMLSTYKNHDKHAFVLFNDTDQDQDLIIQCSSKLPINTFVDANSNRVYQFDQQKMTVHVPKRAYKFMVEGKPF